jgi:hypothetical protein
MDQLKHENVEATQPNADLPSPHSRPWQGKSPLVDKLNICSTLPSETAEVTMARIDICPGFGWSA